MPSESRIVSIAFPTEPGALATGSKIQFRAALHLLSGGSGRYRSRFCNARLLWLWRRHRCGGRILGVVVDDECFSNVESVSRIDDSLHLATIQDHRDALSLGERIQSLPDFVLQRSKQFLTTFLVSRLRVLGLALALFLKLIQL